MIVGFLPEVHTPNSYELYLLVYLCTGWTENSPLINLPVERKEMPGQPGKIMYLRISEEGTREASHSTWYTHVIFSDVSFKK